MNLKEFKNYWDESQHKEWLESVEIDFSSHPCNFHKKFKGVLAYFKFVDKEIKDWDTIFNNSKVPELTDSQNWFEANANRLASFIKRIQNVSSSDLNYYWDSVHKELQYNQDTLFISNSAETNFLISLWNVNPNYVDGAFHFLTEKLQHYRWTDDNDQLFGVFAAYEFKSKDSLVASRKNNEKPVFAALRNSFEKEIATVSKKTASTAQELDDIKETFQNDIQRFHMEKNENFDSWMGKSVLRNDEFYKNAQQRLQDLESTYRDKLMLKEPAKYWGERATDLKHSANRWFLGACITAFFALVILLILGFSLSFENIGEQIKNPAISIRWSILSVIGIALIVFMVRMFTKLSMSAYHLSRDAEERKHLTYLYLSLKNETEIPVTDRHIILQSLFSRSDTGLLKEDSGPTMPGSVIDKIAAK